MAPLVLSFWISRPCALTRTPPLQNEYDVNNIKHNQPFDCERVAGYTIWRCLLNGPLSVYTGKHTTGLLSRPVIKVAFFGEDGGAALVSYLDKT